MLLGFGAIAGGSIADSPSASPDVTIALVGQSVTTAVGTLGLDAKVAIPGQIASTAQGTITPVITAGDVTLALTGISVTTSQGTLGVKFEVVNTGQVSTTAQGILGLKSDRAIAGQSAATAQGTLGVDTKITTVGQSTGTAQGTLGLKSDKALAGQSAATAQGTLGVDTKLAVVGQNVATEQGIITASMGGDLTLPLTGLVVTTAQGTLGVDIRNDITLELAGLSVAASAGSLGVANVIALTGNSIVVSQGSILTAVECSLDYWMSGYSDGGYVCGAGMELLWPVSINQAVDIWQRLGLDIGAPLTESDISALFGAITISKSGTTTVTNTRTGAAGTNTATSALQEAWQRLGLDPANPMSTSDTALNTGTISQAISTAGGVTTVQRL